MTKDLKTDALPYHNEKELPQPFANWLNTDNSVNQPWEEQYGATSATETDNRFLTNYDKMSITEPVTILDMGGES